ncbi:MAG: hypothetical protein N3A72_01395 [bacterium]|nr:hypothetical protein [bacterium]
MALRIKRNPCQVNIVIPDYRIQGTIHLHPMMRFSDFMNAAPEFIPITDAKIFAISDDRLISEPKLLEIRRDQIIFIYPLEAVPVLEELEEVAEVKEDFPDKSLESMYIDLTKKQ